MMKIAPSVEFQLKIKNVPITVLSTINETQCQIFVTQNQIVPVTRS